MTLHPKLPKSYKGAYPFRICTTSYIYPDAIYPNAEYLAPFLDEIELLLFESHAPECLPDAHDIQALAQLGIAENLSFNVHLPIDIVLNDRDARVRRHAADVITHVFDLTAPLSPSTYTLHLPVTEAFHEEDDLKKWQDDTLSGMDMLIGRGIPAQQLSVETLDYDPAWADPVLQAFDLGVCIDIGHLILYGFDVNSICRKYADSVAVVHLHGVKNGRDHLALDMLGKMQVQSILKALKGFTKTLSLEVFSFEHLNASLLFLEKCHRKES